jgi:site-specific DNA recombinase
MKLVRCAVYTRKSTEDGLEQEFNSLDAQREACEAFILSQKHEGWSLIPDQYDDGGFSGGNMERPGLLALMDAVGEGLVDVIVVYKVDRLTRSLADFAKILERLDAKEASFVSVTQAFNTTTSMGRLTLNVLLSFAQFEREVTGERIRDKIAASKKKGLWMGGPVPLGYEVIARKLVPVEEEAKRVRHIMRRFVASSSANELLTELAAEGLKTKIQRRASGPHKGGISFQRGSLFHLLKNPVYRGKIVHKGKLYDGEHEPIVRESLWQAVQQRLAKKAPPRKRECNAKQDAVLKGLLTDLEGRPMVPTWTSKGARQYRYYESRRDLAGSTDPKATRYAMRTLDRHVISGLEQFLRDEHALRRWSGEGGAAELTAIFDAARTAAESLKREGKWRTKVAALISSIRFGQDCMLVSLKSAALNLSDDGCREPLKLDLPQRGAFREAKLKIGDQQKIRADTPQLIALMRDAQQVRQLVEASPEWSLKQIAKSEGRCRKQLARLYRVSCLSPKLVDAILQGQLDQRVSRKQLMESELPLGWSEQHRQFYLI